ncbi:5-oxoprolinase subunit PxpA [Oleiagrimonas sp. C23AA]|uniref:LamB/YcsF family protein n=1 Tax=Oleiagrimonas sp. C23AA TaxID=2719047 RepID=UPI00142201E3|nr:5-oxoprolinase subunit PxpA [Oleiagrimonas sp. C23AA]NII10957.1 LamB/YcsF family protein [Oleiagrimonas sp. C23AA]
MSRIDLNCDMGESFGAWHMGADTEVMPWITSANIACGFHAGDPLTMRHTVRAAVEAGVAIGAHVGLPDLVGFGRRAMAVKPDELEAMCVVQIGALQAMAQASGGQIAHLKPHGALYHMVEADTALADAIVAAVRSLGDGIRIVGLAGGTLVKRAEDAGLAVAHEAFVDRAYQPSGALMPRGQPGAVIEDPQQAVRQALSLATKGEVLCGDGQTLSVRADTLCVHGDRAHAAAFAQALHEGLRRAGVELVRLESTQ